jgi:hypothetical protein
MNLTQEDIRNILILINKASLTGAEALTVVQLQQKLNQMLVPVAETETQPEDNKKKKNA